MVVEYHDGGDHAGGDHEHDAVEVGAWSGNTYNTDLEFVTVSLIFCIHWHSMGFKI